MVQTPALAATPGLPPPAGTQPNAETQGSCSDVVLQPERGGGRFCHMSLQMDDLNMPKRQDLKFN